MAEHEEDKRDDIRSDGGLITGPILFGGIKLAYSIGKDAFSFFRSEDILFIQLLDSAYFDKVHIVRAMIANAYVHSLNLEDLSLVGKGLPQIAVYKPEPSRFGISGADDDKDPERYRISYPLLILPGSSIELRLEIPSISDKKIRNMGGVALQCTYSALDYLSNPKPLEIPLRLRWS